MRVAIKAKLSNASVGDAPHWLFGEPRVLGHHCAISKTPSGFASSECVIYKPLTGGFMARVSVLSPRAAQYGMAKARSVGEAASLAMKRARIELFGWPDGSNTPHNNWVGAFPPATLVGCGEAGIANAIIAIAHAAGGSLKNMEYRKNENTWMVKSLKGWA